MINHSLIFDESSVASFMGHLASTDNRPRGFIIDSSHAFPFDYLKENAAKFANIVFINKYHYPEELLDAKYVLVDWREAGRIAARRFISLGHKRITFLSVHERKYSTPETSIQVSVMKGISEICAESGVEFIEKPFWELLHGASFEATFAEIMSTSNPPTAFFSYSDFFIANEIIPALEKTGRRVGGNVDVIGLYDTPHSRRAGFPSISIHEEKMAATAVDVLLGRRDERKLFIKPELHSHSDNLALSPNFN